MSLFKVANMDITYWSVCLSIRRGGDGVKGVELMFKSVTSFTLIENIKIWCKIQVIIYQLIHSVQFLRNTKQCRPIDIDIKKENIKIIFFYLLVAKYN